MTETTLIVPYYRNPQMLSLQAATWAAYPAQVNVIVVDDCSPEPAAMVVPKTSRARIYRIDVDIPWNRNGARNLGTHVARSRWVLHTDVDHVLEPPYARVLVEMDLDPACWYKFARYRVGAADATRRKDDLPDDVAYGQVKPHVDSFLCTTDHYWETGGYDEDYSGSLGGSSPFLKRAAQLRKLVTLSDVRLHVHTRHSVPDASDVHLSRDRTRYEMLRKKKGDEVPVDPLRFPWKHVR